MMNRRTALAGALPLLALVIAGCSSGQQEQPTASSTANSDPGGATATTAAPTQEDSQWSAQPAPQGQDGTPRGLQLDPETVDTDDAFEVAAAFTTTMLTADAAIDRSPADVSRRAARWADDTYAQVLSADRAGTGGANWVALGQNQGYLTAELTEHPATEAGLVTQAPGDLATEIPILATVTAHDADLEPQNLAVLVSLHRTGPDAPWRVYDWTQEGSR